jgi:hypothetical protein
VARLHEHAARAAGRIEDDPAGNREVAFVGIGTGQAVVLTRRNSGGRGMMVVGDAPQLIYCSGRVSVYLSDYPCRDGFHLSCRSGLFQLPRPLVECDIYQLVSFFTSVKDLRILTNTKI